MIKSFLLCLTTIVSVAGSAQTEAQLRHLDSARQALAFSGMVYPYIDSSPGYLGGEQRWHHYVNSADLMSATIRKAKEEKVPAGRYTVVVRFVVNADSTLSDIKPFGKKAGYGFEEAAVKLVQGSGKWVPAHVEGKHIKSHIQIPISFTISRNN
jgi:hypothetical protein